MSKWIIASFQIIDEHICKRDLILNDVECKIKLIERLETQGLIANIILMK